MREIFEGYYCLLDCCNKDLIDNQPPCSDCENIISFEDFAEIQTAEGTKAANTWGG